MERTVLVIDDDDTARDVVRALLEEGGFDVHTSPSPIGATRLVRDHGVCAVVCDLNMPAMRGDALARLFRSSRVLRDVRLVLISGSSPDELEAAAAAHVADAVLSKAELGERLVRVVSQLVQR